MGYTEAELRQLLYEISYSVRLTTAESPGDPLTTASSISNQIPVNSRANIWSLIATPGSGTMQDLSAYTGGSGDTNYENVLLFVQRLPTTANVGPLELFSGDPLTPAKKTAPVGTLNSDDYVNVGHETDAIYVDMSYYDTPIKFSK